MLALAKQVTLCLSGSTNRGHLVAVPPLPLVPRQRRATPLLLAHTSPWLVAEVDLLAGLDFDAVVRVSWSWLFALGTVAWESVALGTVVLESVGLG